MSKEFNIGIENLNQCDAALFSLIGKMKSAVECGEYSLAQSYAKDFDGLAYKTNALSNRLADMDV